MTPVDPAVADARLALVHPDLRAANTAMRRMVDENNELHNKVERLEESNATLYSDLTATIDERDLMRSTLAAILDGRVLQPANMLHLPEIEWKLELIREYMAGRREVVIVGAAG